MANGVSLSPVLGGRYSWFLFFLAVLLLILYILSVLDLIAVAACQEGVDGVWCRAVGKEPTGGVILAATTIGGLVSALVISVLAVAEPGRRPGSAFSTAARPAPRKEHAVDIYLVAWLLAGLTAFVVGPMLELGDVPTLHDIGLTWLGTAIASMYTYFGIRKIENDGE